VKKIGAKNLQTLNFSILSTAANTIEMQNKIIKPLHKSAEWKSKHSIGFVERINHFMMTLGNFIFGGAASPPTHESREIEQQHLKKSIKKYKEKHIGQNKKINIQVQKSSIPLFPKKNHFILQLLGTFRQYLMDVLLIKTQMQDKKNRSCRK
jgi:hypothetical protein